MQGDKRETTRVGAVDEGAASPTPLFFAFLGALVLCGAVAFRRGFAPGGVTDFLLLAAIVTGTTLVLYAGLMLWATRAGQRVQVIAALRPEALVLHGARARGLRSAVRSLHTDVPFVPIGLTLLADQTGFEVWAGSPEHPIRLGRAPWESVADIRVTRVALWGRAAGGITVTVVPGPDARLVELPFAVLGAGLGGLSAPSGAELEQLAEVLRARRAESLDAEITAS
ncbi:MAG: hypothetical protein QM675_02595 [Protaetiibacter sp.]